MTQNRRHYLLHISYDGIMALLLSKAPGTSAIDLFTASCGSTVALHMTRKPEVLGSSPLTVEGERESIILHILCLK